MAATEGQVAHPIVLVATDCDGTLLDSDEQVSERTVQAIHDAAAAGIELVLVTGRPPRWLPPVIGAIGLRPTCICANGAIVIESVDESVSFVAAVEPEDVLHAAQVLREIMPDVGFAIERVPEQGSLWDHTSNFAHDSEYHPRWPTMPGTIVAPLEQIVGHRPILKLLARSDRTFVQSEVDVIAAEAREALGQRLELTNSERDHLLLEMSAPGIDKGATLARIAAQRGLTAEHVAAIGDMPNDLPMLLWAGHPFAVANAHEQLLAVARKVPSNDDHGVAELLESLARSGA